MLFMVRDLLFTIFASGKFLARKGEKTFFLSIPTTALQIYHAFIEEYLLSRNIKRKYYQFLFVFQ